MLETLHSLTLLYEDASIIAFAKPSGLPSTLGEAPSAVSLALKLKPELSSWNAPKGEAGLIYRIDNETSGLLIFAKNEKEYSRLREAWGKASVRKIYRALCVPGPETNLQTQEITWAISHSAKSAKKMIAHKEGRRVPKSAVRGHPQEAHSKILGVRSLASGVLDLEIQIVTGVRHQIRVHLSTLGAPILGDKLYGGQPKDAPPSRLWLHAWKVELPQKSGSPLLLECPLPTDWPKS